MVVVLLQNLELAFFDNMLDQTQIAHIPLLGPIDYNVEFQILTKVQHWMSKGSVPLSDY